MHVLHEPLGENACLLRLGQDMDVTVNARVHALADALRQAGIDGMQDIIPAYASLLLRHKLSDADAISRWHRRVRDIAADLPDTASKDAGTLHDMPVCYDGEDLDHVAHACGLSRQAVIECHAAPEYRVAMIGFAPGFPYLIGMDPRLATPRHETPRTRVPAGSVAIGGRQTGIYPRELPGGWQLLGHTPARLFDTGNADRPCLLVPGDRVRFRPVDHATFLRLRDGEDAT